MLIRTVLALAANSVSHAAVCNLKIVTDASPDYSDMPAMIRSVTGRWNTPEEKCWAMFYWNHIARRQTAPMMLHGLALTDPIRQFNDYGYTMCSTISGINCSIWDAMGLKTKYWDISNHTVPEVEYGGRWHMYDNSMTALYTSCDGRTIASVVQIGAPGACAASGGKTEPGHIAKYHCLMATSPRGFLTGADTIRGLDEEYRCFNPNGLKHRSYFQDWDRGHRYILNLRDNEVYTRHYNSLGTAPEFFAPNDNGKDPEAANERYHVRGNGVWTFKPVVNRNRLGERANSVESSLAVAHSFSNVAVLDDGGVAPANAAQPGEIVFKIDGANVITALKIHARLQRRTESDAARIAVSTVNGLVWREIWRSDQVGEQSFDRQLVKEINGAYEALVKVSLLGGTRAADAQLHEIEFETTTMLNGKTQPKLALGKNTIYVGAGEQTESIVFWPDLRGANYKAFVVEEKNIATRAQHPGYMGVMHAAKPSEEAYVVFRIDAPRDITRLNYGGRLYNRAPRSRIDFLHSFDGGKNWTRSYALTNTAQPWDVIHYETVDAVPPGTRSALVKYLLQSTAAGSDACSLYALRMEANHRAADAAFHPLDVTFHWSERQADYSLVERSHTEHITQLPHRYTIDVGGADHPVVNALRIAAQGALPDLKPGYSDGRDAGGGKFVSRWVTYGKNLARGKPYTVSVPSNTQWGAGDPDGTRLTDGIVGPPYPGGSAPSFALCWNKGEQPEITLDLGGMKACGAFRIQLGAGWPWWDALKGEFRDRVELLTSSDGREYRSHGFFDLNLRWKDLPANYFWPDEEVIAGHNFEFIPSKPVEGRYVRFKVTPERALTVSEVEVLDSIRYDPFDLRITLPDD
ncbi:MAG: hypothetical protein DME19_06645 [Verrucomicrobia bacterium]|nr:MAG: hypothetical protein DME19_06645 [Verrucomicrobiota bacterium]